MARVVEAEILDSLPPDAPVARRNRRDLRLINALMGNERWFARTAFPHLPPDACVVDLGAGEGRLGLALARQRPDARASGIDLIPAPPAWPAGYAWTQGDWREASLAKADAVLGNMILHQFEDPDLRALGQRIAASSVCLLAFVEPARSAWHVWQLRLLAPALHPVTRHDGAVSIRAGFRGAELPALLGLDAPRWRVSVNHTPLGAYRLLAERTT